MFTGIVEETGVVLGLERLDRGAHLSIQAEAVLEDARIGDSIAVNGCCLTITARRERQLSFDLLGETLVRTNLNDLLPGVPVNLERALRADARLGGHFVQGHVDSTCEILRFDPFGADHRLEVELPEASARYIAFKGSVCLDGISLTVAEVGPESFTVWIIPHTMACTSLRVRVPGDRLNVEFDLLAKYLERLVEPRLRE
jgi:riboflavin synthase